MMDVRQEVTLTEALSQEVRNQIDTSLYSLQAARLAKRNNVTLEDLLRGRNPYFLRSTRKVAFRLVSHCLDNFLLSADEMLFANFSRELSTFTAQCSQQLLEPAALLERFAQDDLPLRIELLTAYARASNRMTHQFYEEFCDENHRIIWERLARFISAIDQ